MGPQASQLMPVITLPDGSQRSYDHPVTVAEVAADIGAGLAKAALAGRVDGRLVDTSFVMENDSELAIVTAKDEDGLEILRHSTAHLLAQAVQAIYPEAQVTIGPVIEDGFYYDFAFSRPFTPEDLEKFEAKMTELAKDETVQKELDVRMRYTIAHRLDNRYMGKGTKAEQLFRTYIAIADEYEDTVYGQKAAVRAESVRIEYAP